VKRLLSPKELADAIGVSESSLKRWADAGRLQVARTEGGHRRIPVAEAVRFIRETGAVVVRPDLLGLVGVPAVNDAKASGTLDERLYQALLVGDGAVARALLVGGYLQGETVAALADGPIRSAMGRLGELWRHDSQGIFLEHRATDLCVQAVVALRGLIEPPAEGLVAVGGAPELDPYMLPSMLAATVLTAAGLRAVNLGPATPLASLRHAVAHHDARVVWLALTSTVSEELAEELGGFARELANAGRTLVLGGQRRADAAGARRALHVAAMSELAAFAAGLVAGLRDDR